VDEVEVGYVVGILIGYLVVYGVFDIFVE